MPRNAHERPSQKHVSRLRAKILATKLQEQRINLARLRLTREREGDAALDYDDPDLVAARQSLIKHRIDGEVARIHREITGYIRNGGQPPTPEQRRKDIADDEERRGWAMVEKILREQ